jgi:Fe-S cluster biogenesis protein NfuA
MSVISRSAVETRVSQLSQLIKAHAGGLVLEDITPQGVVRVRFTGMCAGCENRPVTAIGSIRPALMDIDGVQRVEIVGVRISEEAEERIAQDLRPYSPGDNIRRALAALGAAERLGG